MCPGLTPCRGHLRVQYGPKLAQNNWEKVPKNNPFPRPQGPTCLLRQMKCRWNASGIDWEAQSGPVVACVGLFWALWDLGPTRHGWVVRSKNEGTQSIVLIFSGGSNRVKLLELGVILADFGCWMPLYMVLYDKRLRHFPGKNGQNGKTKHRAHFQSVCLVTAFWRYGHCRPSWLLWRAEAPLRPSFGHFGTKKWLYSAWAQEVAATKTTCWEGDVSKHDPRSASLSL